MEKRQKIDKKETMAVCTDHTGMEYVIKDFGAKVSDALQTSAIQKAIDTCSLAGGGTVVVPAGVFRTGSISLRSNVTLFLKSGAILEGSYDPEDYMTHMHEPLDPILANPTEYKSEFLDLNNFRFNTGLIRAVNVENIAIIGEPGSYIDGVNCYDEQGEDGFRGPNTVFFYNCSNVRLEGYTIRRSGDWAHDIRYGRGVTIRNVTVYGGHDGIDIFACDQVLIEKCSILTGDDAIAGFDNQDVWIRDCYFETSCSVFRFGGTDVRIEGCKAKAPASFGFRLGLTEEQRKERIEATSDCRHNSLNVFLYYCDYRLGDLRSVPGNILIRDCEFVGVDRLFEIYFYPEQIWCCNQALESIKFEDCKCLDLCRPAVIHGDAERPIVFELENMELSARAGCEDMALAECKNFKKISVKNVEIHNISNPRITVQGEGKLDLDEGIQTVFGELF